jgi:hypothetical protein
VFWVWRGNGLPAPLSEQLCGDLPPSRPAPRPSASHGDHGRRDAGRRAQADKAKAKTDLDAIQARYQPQADAFAAEVQTFAVAQGAPPEQVAAAMEQIKGIPAMVRAEIDREAGRPAPGATPQ